MLFLRTLKPATQIVLLLLSLVAVSVGASPCIPGYTYSPISNLCTVNCSLYFNAGSSLKSNPAYQWGCVCRSPYVWSPKDLSCLRLVNCSRVLLSDDSASGVEACKCSDKTQWNPVSMECEVECKAFGRERREGKGCDCPEGEQWVWPKGCVARCQGQGVNTTKGRDPDGACKCLEGFLWNGEQCAVDCAKLDKAKKHQDGSCECIKGYVLNRTLAQCVLNCSEYANTNPEFPIGTSSDCCCLPGYLWESFPTPSCLPTSLPLPRPSSCNPPKTLWNPFSLSC